MVVNLLNDKALNDFLIDFVWNGRGLPKILDGKSQQNLQDVKYLEENKDIVVRSILTQCVKHRMRAFLTENENYPFLIPVSMREDLPDWAKMALEKGEKIYEFDARKMTEKMRHDLTTIRDFLYSIADDYVEKSIVRAIDTKKNPKVRLDYLKTNNELESFDIVLQQAEKWHSNMAKLAEKKAKNEKMYRESLGGTKFVMDLPDGLKAYQLMTPQALDFESAYMGHCVGKGSYDKYVSEGSIKIYSVRDENGEPHATLEVRGQDVYQCKGKGNKTPVQKYIPAIQKFVEVQKLEILHDMKNIGLIKRAGKYYSVYDLPDGFVINGDLDLSDTDFTGVNLNIVVTGKLNISKAKNLPAVLDFSRIKKVDLRDNDLSSVREIKCPSDYIDLIRVRNLPKILDFSRTKQVDLSGADLSGVHEIKCPSDYIDLVKVKNLPQILDFSRTKEVGLEGMDLSGVREIKWPSEEIELNWAVNLPAGLDFSWTQKASLEGADLSGVREIKGASDYIDLVKVENLPKILDFSRTKKVDLNDTNLSGVLEVKWPFEKIELIRTKHLPQILDFSRTKDVYLCNADLSGVREIKCPFEHIDLREAKKLPAVLDFSQTKKVSLNDADLSGVREIRWPLENCDLDVDKLPSHLLKSYKLWKFKKAIKSSAKEIKEATKKLQQKITQKKVVQKEQSERE